jgi:mRNA interferase MazF
VKTPIHRGDVVLVRLDPARGREIRKTRPAVIASNSAACRYDAVVQVAPITATPDRPLRPYEAAVGSRESGVRKPSRAVANQIRTVDKNRLVRRIGRLSAEEIEGLDRAIAIQLGLRRTP